MVTNLPAHYAVQIVHQRADPVRYGFDQRSHTWLVDVDALPRSTGVRFDPRDHFDGTAPTLRAGVEVFLRGHGVELDGGRVTMLANPRVLGYVFNPLSVFWCRSAAGERWVIAEVHNTYRERHAYLVQTDERGRAETPKRFYVSPFNDVDGDYRLSLPEPGERLDVAITLHRDGQRPFVASMRGTRATAGPTPLRVALRSPLLTRAVTAQIRRHGVALYLKGLRVRPRPAPLPQEGVTRR